MSETLYVDRGGEQVYSSPFSALKVDYYGFLISADPDAIQRSVCDHCLNEPSGGEEDFVVAMPYVLIAFNNLPNLVSIDPPWNSRGHFPEKECAFWVLLLDRKRQRLFWHQPYIFVDSAYALTMGRELYGFPKGLGWITVPADHTNPDSFLLETVVVPNFGPNAEAQRLPLIEVKDENGGGSSGGGLISDFEALYATLRELAYQDPEGAARFALLKDEFHDLWQRNVEMVFLKQFRDVGNPALAAYQAITTLDCKMVGFHSAKLYGDSFSVTINDYDSHPVKSDLGLVEGTLNPVCSFWTNIDFRIGRGSLLWPQPN